MVLWSSFLYRKQIFYSKSHLDIWNNLKQVDTDVITFVIKQTLMKRKTHITYLSAIKEFIKIYWLFNPSQVPICNQEKALILYLRGKLQNISTMWNLTDNTSHPFMSVEISDLGIALDLSVDNRGLLRQMLALGHVPWINKLSRLPIIFLWHYSGKQHIRSILGHFPNDDILCKHNSL